MNTLTELYQIDGKAMLAPDENMELSFEDIDAADAGRDESGVMHRCMVRRKVGKWGFHYTHLSQEEYAYMLSILPQEGEFTYTHPSLSDCTQTESCTAYLSGYSVLWRGVKSKTYRDLKFNIIAC